MRPVSANEVALGSSLEWPVYDADGKLLFVQGMVIACQAHLDILLARGRVAPESANSDGVPALEPEPAAGGEAGNDGEAGIGEFELDADNTGDAADTADTASEAEAEPAREAEPPVFRCMQGLRRDLQHLHDAIIYDPDETLAEGIVELADRLRALVARDADAALASMQLEVGDDGHLARLLHAATLCQLLVQAQQWDEAEGRSMVAAALTFDVALSQVAAELNRQSGGLSADQREVVDAHPEAGVELLRGAGVDDPLWLEAVLQHHERLDGSGYPNRLPGAAISRGARLLAIVDIFSAMVRPRAYREAVHARHALRSLFLERGRAVDEQLASLLVREIGVFPPGTPVRLANNEVGVVLRRGSDAAHPLVARLVNANGTLAALAMQRDTAQAEYAIAETVPPHKYQHLVASAGELWCSGRTALRP